MKLLAFSYLLLASVSLSSLLWADSVLATGVDTTAALSSIHDAVLPAVQWATNWGTKVAFGLVGGQLFYTIVIRLVKD